MTSIELVDFAFEPLCVEASGGDVLSLTNSGDAPHTFTVTQVDLNVDLDAGETGEANLTGVAPGLYAVTCTFHPQMVGALKIV
jgi:plastocyanin